MATKIHVTTTKRHKTTLRNTKRPQRDKMSIMRHKTIIEMTALVAEQLKLISHGRDLCITPSLPVSCLSPLHYPIKERHKKTHPETQTTTASFVVVLCLFVVILSLQSGSLAPLRDGWGVSDMSMPRGPLSPNPSVISSRTLQQDVEFMLIRGLCDFSGPAAQTMGICNDIVITW